MVDSGNNDGETPLSMAIKAGHLLPKEQTIITRLLISEAADVEAIAS